MRTETVSIGGTALSMRYNFAALYLFEEVAGTPFDGRKLLHRHLLYWCMLRANNPDTFTMDFDSLVELLNAEPGTAESLDKAFVAVMEERVALLRHEPEDGEEEKKRAPEG